METYTLRSLFNAFRVVIPIIQRDYAQGRADSRAKAIRERFLQNLHEAMRGSGMTLDFVYGVAKDAVFTPLDGQQRLTTLFLLHWYAANVRGLYTEKIHLQNFTYATHPSTRQFCQKLIRCHIHPEGDKWRISEQIRHHESWWIAKWKDDPTISGMLTMLDAIHDEFKDESSMELDKICFYLFDIKHSQPDAIYINMNSRGLTLTPFERLKGNISGHDSRLARKFDNEWTDMLWQMLPLKDDHCGKTLDSYFLNYIRYVCDAFLLTHGQKERVRNDFKMIQTALHTPEAFRTYLEKRFDMWKKHSEKEAGIAGWFRSLLCTGQDGEKLTIDGIFKTSDLFHACCVGYSDTEDSYETTIKFENSQTLLLYACETYLLHADSISEECFLKRLRWVRNLIWNSNLNNKLPALLAETEWMIRHGLPEKVNAFNDDQLKQEKAKEAWRAGKNDADIQALHALEDHPLIRGDVSAVRDWRHPDKCRRFVALFQMEGDSIKACKLLTRALLSMGPIWSDPGSWNVYERVRVTLMNRNQFCACRRNERTIYALDQLLSEESLHSIGEIEAYLGAYTPAEYRRRMAAYTAAYPNGDKDIGDDWNYYFARYAKIMDKSYQGYFVWRGDDIFTITGKRATSGNHFWDVFLLGIEEAVGADNVKCQDNVDHYSTAGKLQIDGKYLMHREMRESKAYFCIADTEGHPVSALPIDAAHDCVQQGASIVRLLLSGGPAGLPQLAEGEAVDGGAE